jgi:hypothetical protein
MYGSESLLEAYEKLSGRINELDGCILTAYRISDNLIL